MELRFSLIVSRAFLCYNSLVKYHILSRQKEQFYGKTRTALNVIL